MLLIGIYVTTAAQEPVASILVAAKAAAQKYPHADADRYGSLDLHRDRCCSPHNP